MNIFIRNLEYMYTCIGIMMCQIKKKIKNTPVRFLNSRLCFFFAKNYSEDAQNMVTQSIMAKFVEQVLQASGIIILYFGSDNFSLRYK